MKYLKKKPVRDLTGDQFLKLSIAAEDKLLEISISEQIEGNTGPSYLEELKQLYQKVSLNEKYYSLNFYTKTMWNVA